MILQTKIKFAFNPGVKKITGEHHNCNPANTSDNIKCHKHRAVHFYHSGHNGRKCADNWKELGKKDRTLSIFIIECFCPQKMLLFKKPGFSSFIEQGTS